MAERTRKEIIEEATKAGEEELRRFYGRLKVIPLLLVYQIWVIAIIQTSGWFAALPACAVAGCWMSGWPKGLWKNIGLFLGLGLLLPIFIGAYGAGK